MMDVLTGPFAGNNSLYACDWNCTAASERTGWVTADAPLKGLERSSYLKPSKSNPLVYCVSQSSLEVLSSSIDDINSIEILSNCSSDK